MGSVPSVQPVDLLNPLSYPEEDVVQMFTKLSADNGPESPTPVERLAIICSYFGI